jgi:glycosyltransferase involved in cell wall biosynthesis
VPKVIHLVPYDGIGGVETAARSMAGHATHGIEFQVDYIYPPDVLENGRYALFHPWPLLRAARRIAAAKPDLLIVSLWRSCLVALLAKLFTPRLRLVLFLHTARDMHWLDSMATRAVAMLSSEIWADSRATLHERMPSLMPAKGRVISFITRHTAPLPARPVRPGFIYWGRLHPQKGLDTALRLFCAVYQKNNSARFTVVGPDGGDLARLKVQVTALDLTEAVHIAGRLDFDGIAHCASTASFYLQTSSVEGMAMSVVEAMQFGLVPVVTPVGEIGNYCRHNENALLVQTEQATVDDIVELLHDDARYQSLSKRAAATWANQPLYAKSILQACVSFFIPLSKQET